MAVEMEYCKWYSPALGREMECKLYGHAGRPVLFIPCQDGRFFDFENYRMIDTWSPWIESGQVTVCSIDTLDRETWSDKGADPYGRIRRHEAWISYIVQEVAPLLRTRCQERNGWEYAPGILAFGCSLGAAHGANLYFRFPDLFSGLLALSGVYDTEYGFGSYMDEVVYRNSPVDYLSGMAWDHPYIEKYNRNRGIICVGQGPWEIPDATRRLDAVLREKGIRLWVDYWGYDCAHDWDWWYRQVAYFVPKLLENG